MKLIWREGARNDARAIFAYIAERDQAAAVRLLDRIEACAERLPDHPYMYRAGRMAETREAVVHPNYILVYRVRAEAVEIVSLIHSRQLYP